MWAFMVGGRENNKQPIELEAQKRRGAEAGGEDTVN